MSSHNTVRFKSAAVLLRSAEHWILQHRDDRVGIAQPGAVGLWGGRSESEEETPVDNALRELREETGLDLSAEKLERITTVRYKLGVMCVDGTTETRHVNATLFLAHLSEMAAFKPMEGQGVIYLPLQTFFP